MENLESFWTIKIRIYVLPRGRNDVRMGPKKKRKVPIASHLSIVHFAFQQYFIELSVNLDATF